MLHLIFGRKLEDALARTKPIRIDGVKFRIRKINPLDYLAGTKAMAQIYDTYQAQTGANVSIKTEQVSKIKEHYADVFLAAVVEPKLKRKEDDSGDGIPVGHLMTDWDMANRLYAEIMLLTYGKKKLRL